MNRVLTTITLTTVVCVPALAEGNFYLGGTVGNASVDTEFDDVGLNFDENDFAWSAYAGVQATEMFAIEASYNDFGRFGVARDFDLTRTEIDAELTGYDVMAVVGLPAGPLRLYGKAGVVYWDAEATAQIVPPAGPAFQLREQDDGFDLALGGGLEFSLGPDLALRGELEWFDVEDTETLWFASVGLTFRF